MGDRRHLGCDCPRCGRRPAGRPECATRGPGWVSHQCNDPEVGASKAYWCRQEGTWSAASSSRLHSGLPAEPTSGQHRLPEPSQLLRRRCCPACLFNDKQHFSFSLNYATVAHGTVAISPLPWRGMVQAWGPQPLLCVLSCPASAPSPVECGQSAEGLEVTWCSAWCRRVLGSARAVRGLRAGCCPCTEKSAPANLSQPVGG